MKIQRALKRVQNRTNLEVRQALAQLGHVKKHGLTGYGDGCRCDVCCFAKKLQGYRLDQSNRLSIKGGQAV